VKSAPLPRDEDARLATLQAYGILDTEPEERFDRLVRLVATLLDVPMATLTLVDRDRQWFKARIGVHRLETPRAVAFCAHAILAEEPLVVEDAHLDPRFRDNPLVTEDGVRFYAGAPLPDRDGSASGVLCAIDAEPRRLTADARSVLVELAAIAADELRLRRATIDLAAEAKRHRLTAERFQGFLETASDWMWETDREHRFTFHSPWSEAVHPPSAMLGRTRWEAAGVDPETPPWAEHRRLLATRRPFSGFRYSLARADGTIAHLEITGRPVFEADGRFAGYRGCGRDVTAVVEAERQRRALTQRLEALDGANVIGLCSGEGERITACNDEFLRIVGRRRHELEVGALSVSKLTPRDEHAVGREIAREMAAHGLCRPTETEYARPDGRRVPVMVTGVLVDRERKGWQAIVQDMSAWKAAEARIADLAFKDPLTGLPNRRCFNEHLSALLAEDDPVGALVLVDLDHFKDVNDALGHDAGDALLREVGARLAATVREDDLVARLGGDEFAVILRGRRARDEVVGIAGRLTAALREPATFAGHEIHPGASLGVTTFPDDGDEPDQLLKNADIALYRSKASGRRTFCFFELSMRADAVAKLALTGEIRQALERREFGVVYQPVVGIDGRRPHGFEALLRWHHPSRGLLAPAAFLAVAEDAGLVPALGRAVLDAVVAQIAEWGRRGAMVKTVAINAAAGQLKDPEFADAVLAALDAHAVAITSLEIEITEGVLLTEDARVETNIRRLHAAGVRIALDDFGTGFASLTHLKRFPVDVLKIDRSFVAEIDTDPDSAVIARAIVNLAHSLQMEVVAEGIETAAQLRALERLGCDFAQGYFFARPGPAPAMSAWLRAPARPKVAAPVG
jgi:diguanylate cyclase (GGDEF)-like protein/PAS domain S-box-containing protein